MATTIVVQIIPRTNIVQLVKASIPSSIHFELLLERLLDAVAQIGWRDIGIGLTEAQIQIHDILIVISTGTLSWLRFGIERMERITRARPIRVPRIKRLRNLCSRKGGKGPNNGDALGCLVFAS